MKKSYEIPTIEFIEVRESDCIVMSNPAFDKKFGTGDGEVDFGDLFGGKN